MMIDILASIDQNMALFGGLILLALVFWFFAADLDRIKRNVGTVIMAALLVFSLASICSPKGWMNVISGKEKFSEASQLRGGIDIVGGTSFILEVEEKEDETTGNKIAVSAEAMEEAKSVIAKRIDEFGVGGASVTTQGNRIEVQLPGVSPEQAIVIKEKLQKVAKLTIHHTRRDSAAIVGEVVNDDGTINERAARDFKRLGVSIYPYQYFNKKGEEFNTFVAVNSKAALGGKDVLRAYPDYASGREVNIELTKDGAQKMRDFTTPLVAKVDQIAAVLDGKVITNAYLNQDSLGKEFRISGQRNLEECEVLSSGMTNPLENPVKILDQRSVSATLGAETVRQGIIAGVSGLALTLIFICIYYRFAGIVALIGLTVNILILFGAMALLGATFTLPGIAGIILTIGVAVDANVLIYERLREELAAGKKLGAALTTQSKASQSHSP